MRVIAVSSAAPAPADAVLEVGVRLRAQRFDNRKDAVALVFATLELARDPHALSRALGDLLGAVPWIGFVGAGVFHDVRLREKKPGLVVLVLEGARGVATSARVLGPDTAALLSLDAPAARARFLSVAADAGTPGALPDLLPALDELSAAPIAGCLSLPPAGQTPSVLAAGGAAAAAILDVDGVTALLGVAQAARPLGPTRAVTAASANLIQELDGRPAYEALLRDLPAQLRSQIPRLGGALCAGLGTADGDALLMRNVVGLDPRTGAVAVAGQPRVGTEIVFSLRDQAAARQDLDEMLTALDAVAKEPRAFVVFTCATRDEGLFGVPNYDVQQILARFGTEVPVVGVAGGGELCTYGTGTYLFGKSCVVAALL